MGRPDGKRPGRSNWFEGTGADAGLSYFEWVEASNSLGPVGYPITGLIFPGSPPRS